jgi:periodic tryptophan protein 1
MAAAAGMLTTLAWVPMGAMRSVPLKAAEEAAQAKAILRQREGADGSDDDAANADGDESDSGEDVVFTHGAGNVTEQIESDDEEEVDDMTYKDTDLVFVASRASDDPHFEVYVYDEPKDNLFLHHDAHLSAFPLCSTWLSDGQTSLLAVGTMHPFVEIWSLDVVDPVQPLLVLGGCEQVEKNYKRRMRKEWLKEESHTDAVVSIQWNRKAQQYLATGGADAKIKLWDLLAGSCVGTYAEKARVQATEWHPTESNLLLSCCGDELSIRDCRQPDAPACRWNVTGDTIENVKWDVHSGSVFASTHAGKMCAFEAKMSGAKLWEVEAHGSETVFDISPHAPLLCAGGKDGLTTLWDIRTTPQAPIVERKLGVGQTFQVQFHPNMPQIVGAVGSNGQPLVYTVAEDAKHAGFTL